MVKDGLYYALALLALAAIGWYFFGPAFAVPQIVLAAFCLYFFRDPDRIVPEGPVAVSPADGKVVNIHSDQPGLTRISVFLNIFDVHVNRSPIAGEITSVRYQTGKFLVASREEATAHNEQNVVTVQGDGTSVIFSQIAGLIARRIVFRKKIADRVEKGERVGLIKFGSRVDIFLGPEWDIAVKTGERVQAGSSVLARRRKD
jgi:phosphatidylserine decarboxylase